MIITKSNALLGVQPSVNEVTSGLDPASMTDPDHSLTYTSGSASTDFTVSFGAQSDIEYVAISGHNGNDSGNTMSVAIKDNGSTIASGGSTDNNVLVITFTKRNFTDLQVVFQTNPNTYRITVAYIAAGEYIEVPNDGEQSGYSRGWMNRGVKQRVSTNQNAMPLALTQRRIPLKASLKIPNADTVFSRQDWHDFTNYAVEQPFFIREIDIIVRSSYICFNPNFDMVKAHPQTRALDSITLRFDLNNGI